MLRSSFIQIRKIAIFLIFLQVLAICKCKISNRLDGIFYPLILYSTTCLCKLPNRSDGFFYLLTLNDLFTCCASYQIGKINSSTLWHLTAYLLYKILNKSYRLFYPLTLDNSFTISQNLDGDHKYGLYTTKVLADVWSTCLVGLICRYHSNSYFKTIGRQDPVDMMMGLTCTSSSMILMQWGCSNNDVVQKRAYSDGEKNEVEIWLDHIQPMIITLQLPSFLDMSSVKHKICWRETSKGTLKRNLE